MLEVNAAGQGLNLVQRIIEPNNLSYGYFFNAAGLQVDRVASAFGAGKGFTLMPFKGIYWKFSTDASFCFTTNVYPVSDLSVPFLGVHVTPGIDGMVSLGPTAIPAWGREN